jgi:hypothetical protein
MRPPKGRLMQIAVVEPCVAQQSTRHEAESTPTWLPDTLRITAAGYRPVVNWH